MNKEFFDEARRQFGSFTQIQVDCANAICDLAQRAGAPLPHVAYMLATAWHEAHLKPQDEHGQGAGHTYGQSAGPYGLNYFGRGLVQLTWLRNYEYATQRLRTLNVIGVDIDLVKNPELANRPDIAAAILVYGMTEGWFTEKKLSDFDDFYRMRTVVNGYDCASLIVGYARKWEAALEASQVTFGATMRQPSPTIQIPSAKARVATAGVSLNKGAFEMLNGTKTYTLGTVIVSVIGTLLGTGLVAAPTGIGGIAFALLAVALRHGLTTELNKLVAKLIDAGVAGIKTQSPVLGGLAASVEPAVLAFISKELAAMEARLLDSLSPRTNGISGGVSATPIGAPLPRLDPRSD